VVPGSEAGTTTGGGTASNADTAGTPPGGPDDDEQNFKRPNDKLEKGDRIDLERFSRRIRVEGETRFEDPKSGYHRS
jgi:hypothetical protein